MWIIGQWVMISNVNVASPKGHQVDPSVALEFARLAKEQNSGQVYTLSHTRSDGWP